MSKWRRKSGETDGVEWVRKAVGMVERSVETGEWTVWAVRCAMFTYRNATSRSAKGASRSFGNRADRENDIFDSERRGRGECE